MALNYNDLLTLARTVAKANPSAPTAYSFNGQNFDYASMHETLKNEFAELAPDYRQFQINKNVIYSLMEQTIDEVLPARVLEQYSQFAEIKTFKQGEKPIFTQRITQASRRRAKQFIGKVG